MRSLIADQSRKSNVTKKEVDYENKDEKSRKLLESRHNSEYVSNEKYVAKDAVQLLESQRTSFGRRSILLREAKEEPIKPKELSYWSKKGWVFIFTIIEIIFFILYALSTTYDMSINVQLRACQYTLYFKM